MMQAIYHFFINISIIMNTLTDSSVDINKPKHFFFCFKLILFKIKLFFFSYNAIFLCIYAHILKHNVCKLK